MEEEIIKLLSEAYDELSELLDNISDIDTCERIQELLKRINEKLYNQI
mgnify:CR=1 FL=1